MYRRVSGLTDSDSPQLPTRLTGYYGNKRISPISEMSPESTPAELYSPPPDSLHSTYNDYFVGRRRQRGATTERERESSEASASPQFPSSHADGVNPWDVEYHPNPVIFAHMSTLHVSSSTEPKATYMSDCSNEGRNRPRSLATITERRPSHARGLSDTAIQGDSISVSQPTPE
jgi:hypothetical protein